MNTITKRVPREPDEHMTKIMRRTAEDFGFDVDAKLLQFMESLYQGAVSAAPIDPLDAVIEQIATERLGS